MKCKVKYRFPDVEGNCLPEFLYKEEFDVIYESNETVIIRWNKKEMYTFEFNKINVERL